MPHDDDRLKTTHRRSLRPLLVVSPIAPGPSAFLAPPMIQTRVATRRRSSHHPLSLPRRCSSGPPS